MEDENCLFCELISNEKLCLYSDSNVAVLLDKYPMAMGHILVIPKEHAKFMHELSENSLENILPTMKKIVNKLGFKKYNILQNNNHIQIIFHVHFHIIPYNNDSECLKLKMSPIKCTPEEVEKKFCEMKKLLNS